jgi:hypothetical protein
MRGCQGTSPTTSVAAWNGGRARCGSGADRKRSLTAAGHIGDAVTKIEHFAKAELGITVTKKQLGLIRDWMNAKPTGERDQQATWVMRQYVLDGLREVEGSHPAE